jgi:flavorubredoxin
MHAIKPSITSVGASDPERKLFDELIPLPDGTTYNSYFIQGSEKNALIDSVDPTKSQVLLKNLKALNVKSIDYVIAHHAEQDHSGSIPFVLDNYPDAKVVCSEKCKPMLMDLLGIKDEKFRVVKDKEILSLGDKTLEFIYTPWVHWPETMVTYLHEDKLLFSCDFFGSHYATEDLLNFEDSKLAVGFKRYFAEIMMPFRSIIKSNIEKLSAYDIGMIAPSHGPIHTKPENIMGSYKQWISDDVKNLAIVAYVSMHGSTKAMADYLCDALEKRGVETHKHDLTGADLGHIATDLVDAATVIVGTPTLLAGIHPTAAHAVYLVNALRPKTKNLSIIGSYGWMSRQVETIAPMLTNLKSAEIIPPVLAKGFPKEADYAALDRLADAVAEKHKALVK